MVRAEYTLTDLENQPRLRILVARVNAGVVKKSEMGYGESEKRHIVIMEGKSLWVDIEKEAIEEKRSSRNTGVAVNKNLSQKGGTTR